MPDVKLYLDQESYESYQKLKMLLKEINKIRRTKLSVSVLVANFIRTVAEILTENLDPNQLHKKSAIVIDLPKLEINIGGVDVKESPKYSGQVQITAVILWQQYKEFKRRFKYAMKIANKNMRLKTLSKLRDDIINELKKHKKAPKDLIEEFSKLLAKIDTEIDSAYGSFIDSIDFT